VHDTGKTVGHDKPNMCKLATRSPRTA